MTVFRKTQTYSCTCSLQGTYKYKFLGYILDIAVIYVFIAVKENGKARVVFQSLLTKQGKK